MFSAIQLESGSPDVVVLAYASFQDGRNVLGRKRRERFSTFRERFPVHAKAWLDNGRLRYGVVDLRYQPFPLANVSSLVRFVERQYGRLEIVFGDATLVTREILLEFQRLCDEREADFVLAGIHPSRGTAARIGWAAQQGIRTVDVSSGMADPANVLKDGHPNDRGTSLLADRIGATIELVLDQP